MNDIDNITSGKQINWVARIAKQGDARIITVPKNYWESGLVDENKKYRIFLVEIEDKK